MPIFNLINLQDSVKNFNLRCTNCLVKMKISKYPNTPNFYACNDELFDFDSRGMPILNFLLKLLKWIS